MTDLQINMFKSQPNNDLRKLPLSRRALEHHTSEAFSQAGYI